jgi:DNA-binding response OmpR family regulator
VLRDRPELIRLRQIQTFNAELRQAVDLLEQGSEGGIEFHYGRGSRATEDDVAMEMAEIEHGDAKVITGIFDGDIEANAALSRVLDLLIFEHSEDTDCPNRGEQDKNGEANKAPRSCFAFTQSHHLLLASNDGADSVHRGWRAMLRPMKILLIEDEPAIARMIKRGLSPHGHEVIAVESGEDPVIPLTVDRVDLVLLDIHLPGKDGLEVLADIRRMRQDLPIMMLTALDDLGSKVSALDGGADDYITKPFAFEELVARIRALTRRVDQKASSQLDFGELRIDLLSHRVSRQDQVIELSRREFALLEYFARNPNRVLSRQQILSAVWEYDFEGESNVVDVYVRYLRQKLEQLGISHVFTTIRGSGYRFDPPGRA